MFRSRRSARSVDAIDWPISCSSSEPGPEAATAPFPSATARRPPAGAVGRGQGAAASGGDEVVRDGLH